MSILTGLVAFYVTKHFFPDWPLYVYAILAFQLIILTEIGYIQHYVKEIKEKLGIE
ncbi:MAG: hypothetical protein KAJ55_04670 [Anaerolineales bacterium]|nr:hypothetical protein [Anaerolineales bacterium]